MRAAVEKGPGQRRSHREKSAGEGQTKVEEAEVACVKQGVIWTWDEEEGEQGIDRERWKSKR